MKKLIIFIVLLMIFPSTLTGKEVWEKVDTVFDFKAAYDAEYCQVRVYHNGLMGVIINNPNDDSLSQSITFLNGLVVIEKHYVTTFNNGAMTIKSIKSEEEYFGKYCQQEAKLLPPEVKSLFGIFLDL